MHTETIVLDPDRKDVTLTALCWDPSPALQDASRPRPGLLILPGGGYQSHAHREMDPIALRFAARNANGLANALVTQLQTAGDADLVVDLVHKVGV